MRDNERKAGFGSLRDGLAVITRPCVGITGKQEIALTLKHPAAGSWSYFQAAFETLKNCMQIGTISMYKSKYYVRFAPWGATWCGEPQQNICKKHVCETGIALKFPAVATRNHFERANCGLQTS
ncbi:MAG: hypothetical protein AAF724_04570 [Pseudomonadota bacterium]